MAEENEKTKDKEKTEDEKLLAEAKELGVTRSKISVSPGFRTKDSTPEKLAKEENKQNKLADERLKDRVEQAKVNAKIKPIDKRKNLLVSRFKAVKSRARPNNYSDANIKAWLEELKMIDNNPKSWNKVTKNGTIPFIPDNRRKKTAKEMLDSMDLD